MILLKLQRWQQVAVALVVLAFFGAHWQRFASRFRTAAMTQEESLMLMSEAQSINLRASKTIQEGSYQPEQFARDMIRLREIETQDGFWFHEQVSSVHTTIADMYLESRRDMKTRQRILLEQDRILEPGRQEGWRNFRQSLKTIYLHFLPFVFPILLIRRIPVKRWKCPSFGETVSIILSLIFWPIGVFAYRPSNFFQQRLDYQVRRWKEKVGERGWRLAVAYTVALIVTILSSIKPQLSWAGEVVKIQIVQTQPSEESDQSTSDGVDVVAILQETFYRLFRFIKRFLQILEVVNISPTRRILWLQTRPIRSLPEMFVRLGRAPRTPPMFACDLINNSRVNFNVYFGGCYEIDFVVHTKNRDARRYDSWR